MSEQVLLEDGEPEVSDTHVRPLAVPGPSTSVLKDGAKFMHITARACGIGKPMPCCSELVHRPVRVWSLRMPLPALVRCLCGLVYL